MPALQRPKLNKGNQTSYCFFKKLMTALNQTLHFPGKSSPLSWSILFGIFSSLFKPPRNFFPHFQLVTSSDTLLSKSVQLDENYLIFPPPNPHLCWDPHILLSRLIQRSEDYHSSPKPTSLLCSPSSHLSLLKLLLLQHHFLHRSNHHSDRS